MVGWTDALDAPNASIPCFCHAKLIDSRQETYDAFRNRTIIRNADSAVWRSHLRGREARFDLICGFPPAPNQALTQVIGRDGDKDHAHIGKGPFDFGQRVSRAVEKNTAPAGDIIAN